MIKAIIKILKIRIHIHLMKRIHWRKTLYVQDYDSYTDYALGPFYMNIDSIRYALRSQYASR